MPVPRAEEPGAYKASCLSALKTSLAVTVFCRTEGLAKASRATLADGERSLDPRLPCSFRACEDDVCYWD